MPVGPGARSASPMGPTGWVGFFVVPLGLKS